MAGIGQPSDPSELFKCEAWTMPEPGKGGCLLYTQGCPEEGPFVVQASQPADAQSPSQVLTPPPPRARAGHQVTCPVSRRWTHKPGSDKGACEAGGHPPPLQIEPGSPESETLWPGAQLPGGGGSRDWRGAAGCHWLSVCSGPPPRAPRSLGSLVLKGLVVKDLHLLRALHAQMCFHKFTRTGRIQRN